jgi:hypothetical protein
MIWRQGFVATNQSKFYYEVLVTHQDENQFKKEVHLKQFTNLSIKIQNFDPNYRIFIEFFCGADQKFNNLVLNITSPLSTFWCGWCTASDYRFPHPDNKPRTMIELICAGLVCETLPKRQKAAFALLNNGVCGVPLLPFISMDNTVPEFLHLLLRTTEKQTKETAACLLQIEGLYSNPIRYFEDLFFFPP